MPATNLDIIAAASQLPLQALAADGAISISTTIPKTACYITKGSAAALTLADPATSQDGLEVEIYSETAFAHVVTAGTSGFNGKGASGTATFGAAKGNGIRLIARGGKWWVTSNIGVTIA